MTTQLPPTANAYLRTRVLSASPEELRLMLLDGAIKFLRQGREAMTRKDFEGIFNGFSQAREIVFELLTTIREDVNPELAAQAKALYAFIYRSLVEAGHEKDLAKTDRVIELLEFERETWVMLMRKLAEERGTTTSADVAPAAAPAPAPARAVLSVQG